MRAVALPLLSISNVTVLASLAFDPISEATT